jgi:hypothetical protein
MGPLHPQTNLFYIQDIMEFLSFIYNKVVWVEVFFGKKHQNYTPNHIPGYATGKITFQRQPRQ